jgi:hypothetical protein
VKCCIAEANGKFDALHLLMVGCCSCWFNAQCIAEANGKFTLFVVAVCIVFVLCLTEFVSCVQCTFVKCCIAEANGRFNHACRSCSSITHVAHVKHYFPCLCY